MTNPWNNSCHCDLGDYLSQRLDRFQTPEDLALDRFPELQGMKAHAAAELLKLMHSKNHCCTLNFILYLCFCCKDVEGVVADLRKLVREVYLNQSNTESDTN